MINGSLTTTTETPPVTNPPLTYTCDKSVSCGCSYNNVILPPSRIVGGNDAVPNSWSMVVSLRNIKTNRFFCGGTILSDSFILTAVHCVTNRQVPGPDGLFIVAGSNK
jgi:secreted trypsin-like serine protease